VRVADTHAIDVHVCSMLRIAERVTVVWTSSLVAVNTRPLVTLLQQTLSTVRVENRGVTSV
jgi:hypothetical protein